MTRPLIVAELGASHLGSFARALNILDVAIGAGADAFKVQVWSPDTRCVDRSYVIESGAWKGQRLHDLYRECFTPWDWVPKLFREARERGMLPFASVFDEAAVEFVDSLDVPIFKIASYEVTDLHLLRLVAATGKQVILSTGASTYEELKLAVDQFPVAADLTLLHCVSEYPSQPQDANLATMLDLTRLGCQYGLSDHSMGVGVAVAAAGMGAAVVEKHLTLRRSDGGPDSGFAMEPEEFAVMVHAVRQAAVARGIVNHVKSPSGLRRSLWIAREAMAGDQVTPEHIRSARPALGISCRFYDHLIGQSFARDVVAGSPLRPGDIAVG